MNSWMMRLKWRPARGILSKYANNDLLEEENTAWEKAVAEKYGNG